MCHCLTWMCVCVCVHRYTLQECPDPPNPDPDYSITVLSVVFAWAFALVAVFTTVVIVYSRNERAKIREETKHMSRLQRKDSLRQRRKSFKERMMLSPLKKFARHGKFPVKLLVHLLTVLFSVSYITLHNNEFSAFVAANEESFRSALGADSGLDTTALDYTAVYTVPDLASRMDKATTNYFNYALTSIGEVTTSQSLLMTQQFWNGSSLNSQLTSQSGGGPFSNLTRTYCRGPSLMDCIVVL